MNTFFQDIEYHLIKSLEESNQRILIAVAWFTNLRIAEILVKNDRSNIDIILDENKINRTSKAVKLLQSNNVSITFIKDLKNDYYLMHNKFCVIDNFTTLTGSYNWTNNANKNDENLTKIINKETAIAYNLEFSRIKNKRYLNENIDFSRKEREKIKSLIRKEIISIIKINIDNLEFGLILNWTDYKIKNKIREISERLNNTLNVKVGAIGVYSDLLSKYGIEFNSFASESEKAKSRHKFKEIAIKTSENFTESAFENFKIRVISKMLSEYIDLLKTAENKKYNNIRNIILFLIKERTELCKLNHNNAA